jgi:hypothetical protein
MDYSTHTLNDYSKSSSGKKSTEETEPYIVVAVVWRVVVTIRRTSIVRIIVPAAASVGVSPPRKV